MIQWSPIRSEAFIKSLTEAWLSQLDLRCSSFPVITPLKNLSNSILDKCCVTERPPGDALVWHHRSGMVSIGGVRCVLGCWEWTESISELKYRYILAIWTLHVCLCFLPDFSNIKSSYSMAAVVSDQLRFHGKALTDVSHYKAWRGRNGCCCSVEAPLTPRSCCLVNTQLI